MASLWGGLSDTDLLWGMLAVKPRTTSELHAVSRKYTGRISDLRALGLTTTSVPIVGTGDYLYTLVPNGPKAAA